MSFVTKSLYRQIVKLFTDYPEYRDDRYKTFEYIVTHFYTREYGRGIVNIFVLAHNIDRAFRYVQQHVPELRGENWLQRQRQAGEITEDELREKTLLKKVCEQLKIKFE